MAQLVGLLTRYGIPVEKYGIGISMPLQALLEQIQEGTIELEERNGKLFRSIWLLSIEILYQDKDKMLRLYEDRQTSLDKYSGREIAQKKRRRKMDWSIAKKVPKHKWTKEGVGDVLRQELGLQIGPHRLLEDESKIYYRHSDKFPGFKNHVRAKRWILVITPKEFKREGYIFDDKYLRSYFSWKMVE